VAIDGRRLHQRALRADVLKEALAPSATGTNPVNRRVTRDTLGLPLNELDSRSLEAPSQQLGPAVAPQRCRAARQKGQNQPAARPRASTDRIEQDSRSAVPVS